MEKNPAPDPLPVPAPVLNIDTAQEEHAKELAAVLVEMEAVLGRHDLVGTCSVVDEDGIATAVMPQASWTAFKVLTEGIALDQGSPADPLYRERLNQGIIALLRTLDGLQKLSEGIVELLDDVGKRYPWKQLIRKIEVPNPEAPRIITPGDPQCPQFRGGPS